MDICNSTSHLANPSSGTVVFEVFLSSKFYNQFQVVVTNFCQANDANDSSERLCGTGHPSLTSCWLFSNVKSCIFILSTWLFSFPRKPLDCLITKAPALDVTKWRSLRLSTRPLLFIGSAAHETILCPRNMSCACVRLQGRSMAIGLVQKLEEDIIKIGGCLIT